MTQNFNEARILGFYIYLEVFRLGRRFFISKDGNISYMDENGESFLWWGAYCHSEMRKYIIDKET